MVKFYSVEGIGKMQIIARRCQAPEITRLCKYYAVLDYVAAILFYTIVLLLVVMIDSNSKLPAASSALCSVL